MTYLSTGEPSTLGGYLTISRRLFGDHSRAVTFLHKRIQHSPRREHEPVLADESQMLRILSAYHAQGLVHDVQPYKEDA